MSLINKLIQKDKPSYLIKNPSLTMIGYIAVIKSCGTFMGKMCICLEPTVCTLIPNGLPNTFLTIAKFI